MATSWELGKIENNLSCHVECVKITEVDKLTAKRKNNRLRNKSEHGKINDVSFQVEKEGGFKFESLLHVQRNNPFFKLSG